jgi:hypothetical protein
MAVIHILAYKEKSNNYGLKKFYSTGHQFYCTGLRNCNGPEQGILGGGGSVQLGSLLR